MRDQQDKPEPSDEPACVECGRPIAGDGRFYSDGVGELVPYCAECAEREFVRQPTDPE